MLLENLTLFWNMETFAREHGLSYSSLFFSGGQLSTHCFFQYLGHLSIFFNSFFLNNFCLAHTSFLRQNFIEIATRTWSIYLVDEKPIKHVFVFTPSVGVKHFWVDLNRMACFCAYPQCRSSAYLGGVYVILILRAWQTSKKVQQSLTKLNAKASSIYVEVLLA